jgi:hypothetical protein
MASDKDKNIIIDDKVLDEKYAEELAGRFESEWGLEDYDIETIEYTSRGVTYRALKALNTPDAVIAQVTAQAHEKHMSPETFVNNAIRKMLASA